AARPAPGSAHRPAPGTAQAALVAARPAVPPAAPAGDRAADGGRARRLGAAHRGDGAARLGGGAAAGAARALQGAARASSRTRPPRPTGPAVPAARRRDAALGRRHLDPRLRRRRPATPDPPYHLRSDERRVGEDNSIRR